MMPDRFVTLRLILLTASTLAAAAAMLVFSVMASATMPPRSCGNVRVRHHTYLVKAHLIPCSQGKPWAVSYLRSGKHPRGYSCRKFDPDQTEIRFLCSKGIKDFYALRR